MKVTRLNKLHWWIRGKIYTIRLFLYPRTKLTLHSLKRSKWYDPDALILHAAFQILVNHVEDDLSRLESLNKEMYSSWVRFQIRWLPKVFRNKLSKALGLYHLDRVDFPVVGAAQRVKSLYLWYVNELPLLESPIDTLPDPEYHYIDPQGNPTNVMFDKTDEDEYYMINKFHPDYVKYLETFSKIERNQKNIINQKLRELMEIREFLWV